MAISRIQMKGTMSKIGFINCNHLACLLNYLYPQQSLQTETPYCFIFERICKAARRLFLKVPYLQYLEGDRHEWHACCCDLCKAKPHIAQYVSTKRDNLPFIKRKRVERNLMKNIWTGAVSTVRQIPGKGHTFSLFFTKWIKHQNRRG